MDDMMHDSMMMVAFLCLICLFVVPVPDCPVVNMCDSPICLCVCLCLCLCHSPCPFVSACKASDVPPNQAYLLTMWNQIDDRVQMRRKKKKKMMRRMKDEGFE